jgi:hypothetical protein
MTIDIICWPNAFEIGNVIDFLYDGYPSYLSEDSSSQQTSKLNVINSKQNEKLKITIMVTRTHFVMKAS